MRMSPLQVIAAFIDTSNSVNEAVRKLIWHWLSKTFERQQIINRQKVEAHKPGTGLD